MTVVVEETPTTEVSPPGALARWHLRACALALDVVPGAAVTTTSALVALTVRQHPVWWWLWVSVGGLAILWVLVNRWVLPAVTGSSPGRGVCGISVRRRDGGAPGAWGLLLRDLAHLLDVASVVGWLWPLWDSGRRTFADMVLRTDVRSAETDRRTMRRWTAGALLTAAAVCVAGSAAGYALVYSRERATDQTVAQLAIQGPKIVTQMLTYDPKSLDADFARARSLATDSYRGTLATQQEVVAKGHPVINEYWVTDSSIQSASPDRATMLLFLQGRRGASPNERYITASVRVRFAKRGADWRVDDLTVLTKPKSGGGEK
ncbi:RDD family protein [Mycobacterium sp. THU-M116]